MLPLHQQLALEISSRAFQRRYKALGKIHSILRRYPTTEDLLKFLWDWSSEDYDLKDACLHALITASQTGRRRAAATRLLLRAMHPALGNLCSRLAHARRHLCSEIDGAFLEEVHAWKPSKMNKVAINLKLRTLTSLLKQFKATRKEKPLDDERLLEKKKDLPIVAKGDPHFSNPAREQAEELENIMGDFIDSVEI